MSDNQQTTATTATSDEAASDTCTHWWAHLRSIPFENKSGDWGDEFFCCRCLAKRQERRS